MHYAVSDLILISISRHILQLLKGKQVISRIIFELTIGIFVLLTICHKGFHQIAQIDSFNNEGLSN